MSPRSLLRHTLLLTLLFATLPAIAQSSGPTFTIAAGNATVTTFGTAAIPYTLTSVNGYIGTVTVTCHAPTVAAGVNIPNCFVPLTATNCNPNVTNSPPPNVCNLTANQVFASSFGLNGTTPVPLGFMASHNAVLSILFIVALLSGLTLRRGSARRLTLPLFLATLAALSCTTGCGSAPKGFTPGTYTYVISAAQSPVPLVTSANATVTIH